MLVALGCTSCSCKLPPWVLQQHSSADSLQQQTIDRCVRETRSQWGRGNVDAPVVLTYATQISEPFLLGVSAAMHGMPLVVSGLGMPGWNWWDGVVLQKVSAPRRALQIVQALLGDVPVAVVDAGDVLVCNGATTAHRRALDRMGRTVLLGAECNSWPVCYAKAYAQDAGHQRCVARHGPCFPNGGISLGRSSTMLDFLSAFRQVGQTTMLLPNLAERGNDQTALHHLYMNRSRFPSLDVQVDSVSRFSLQLWTCNGNAKDGGFAYHLRRGGPYEYCHNSRHTPLEHIHVRRDGVLAFNETRNGSAVGHVQHPMFIHSNGYHYKMQDPVLGSLLDKYNDPERRSETFDTPVLLVEWQHEGKVEPCAVSSLGWLMNSSRHPEGAPGLFVGRRPIDGR